MPVKSKKQLTRVYVRQVREEPDSHKITLDILSPFESFWLSAMISGVILLMLSIKAFIFAETSDLGIYLVKSGFLSLIVGFIGYNMVSEYYILDFERQALIFHSEKFGLVSESVVAQPFEMAAVAVDGFAPGEGAPEWRYKLLLILGDKDAIALSDPIPGEDGLNKLNDKARRIAKNLNIPFFESPGRKFVAPENLPDGRVTIRFSETRILPVENRIAWYMMFFTLFITISLAFFYEISFKALLR